MANNSKHVVSLKNIFARPFLGAAFLLAFLIAAESAPLAKAFAAELDISGTWTGSSLAGGSVYPNIFELKLNGNIITGTQIANGALCQVTGTLSSEIIRMHTTCSTLNYSSDSIATTTDGATMSGTFLDSQGTRGTFTAQKTPTLLSPGTSITVAPQVQVSPKVVIFTLQKFTKVSLSKARYFSRAKAPKLSLQYELSIVGPEKRKITSKKNVVSAKNLKPGNYSSNYKVTALKDGKKAYSTKASPSTSFTVVKK